MKKILSLITLVFAIALSAHAQFLGYVAGQSVATQVFSSQAANGNSSTVQNIGQSAHFLTYCNTNFSGTISLQASPDGTFSTPITIASASYGQNSVTDSACHVLQAGGYYQSVRASVTNYASGSVNAWYTAIGLPIAFAPSAVGSNGPTAPIQCDKTALIQPAQSTTTNLIGVLGGANIYICMMSISFSAATTTGTIVLEETTAANCTTVVGTMWQLQLTASTPQILPQIGGTLGAFTRTLAPGHAACVVTGAITAATTLQVSYAQF